MSYFYVYLFFTCLTISNCFSYEVKCEFNAIYYSGNYLSFAKDSE